MNIITYSCKMYFQIQLGVLGGQQIFDFPKSIHENIFWVFKYLTLREFSMELLIDFPFSDDLIETC